MDMELKAGPRELRDRITVDIGELSSRTKQVRADGRRKRLFRNATWARHTRLPLGNAAGIESVIPPRRFIDSFSAIPANSRQSEPCNFTSLLYRPSISRLGAHWPKNVDFWWSPAS